MTLPPLLPSCEGWAAARALLMSLYGTPWMYMELCKGWLGQWLGSWSASCVTYCSRVKGVTQGAAGGQRWLVYPPRSPCCFRLFAPRFDNDRQNGRCVRERETARATAVAVGRLQRAALCSPPAYLKVHTAFYHFLGNGKIRRFGCSLLFSGVASAVQVDCRRP